MSFFAICPHAELKAEIAALLKPWQQLFPHFTWVHPDDFHLTLRFLPGLSESLSRDLVGRMRSSSLSRFTIPLRACTVFDKGRKGGVLCAAVASSSELLALRNEIEAQLQGLGYPVDSQIFTPHVTLGRFEQDALADVAVFCSDEKDRVWGLILADSYQLMKRRPYAKAGEALYESLGSFALRDPEAPSD